ncbi:hypothetical protein [cyanobacterium endosymbiont of Rhopalodia gibberula]|nr:hypothetical protein [cyanobacterium endosymbiont of Rhopalodia gibberula]
MMTVCDYNDIILKFLDTEAVVTAIDDQPLFKLLLKPQSYPFP